MIIKNLIEATEKVSMNAEEEAANQRIERRQKKGVAHDSHYNDNEKKPLLTDHSHSEVPA